MTTLAVVTREIDRGSRRHARPHGIDRLVMKLSLTTLLWARRRADRHILTREQHAMRLEQVNALAERERSVHLMVSRVF